jgi:TPR repeat protein
VRKASSPCYYEGEGVEQNHALAAAWGRKAADQGGAAAQFLVGKIYASGEVGVKKDLPLGTRRLERSAAQGLEWAVMLLKDLRKCVACGELDVHHMICAWCRNVRYCDGRCQLRHWHWHKPHCGRRREVAGGVSTDPTAVNDECAVKDALEVEVTAVTATVEAAKVAAEGASAARGAAVTAVTAARAAADAAPAASKKEKKKKAKLVAKVKAVDATMHAAVTAAEAAYAAVETAAEAAIEAARAGSEVTKAVMTRQAAS